MEEKEDEKRDDDQVEDNDEGTSSPSYSPVNSFELNAKATSP